MTKKKRKNKSVTHGSFAHSMNRYYIKGTITPKILIVGTITPEAGKGYYYTSKENEMYSILKKAGLLDKDDINRKNDMIPLKEEILDFNSPQKRMNSIPNSNKQLIVSISKKLNGKGVYFFDVFSEVIRKEHNNPGDNNIESYNLDYDSFSKINLTKDCFIIANSVKAKNLLLKIMKVCKPNYEYQGRLFYMPQMRRIYKSGEHFGLTFDEAWSEMLNYCLNDNDKKLNKKVKSFIVKKI